MNLVHGYPACQLPARTALPLVGKVPRGDGFSVVIPMYNEVGNVARLVEELVESISEYEFEVVLVDDGSKDGTSAELAAVAEGEPRVRVVYLTANSNARTCRSFTLINARAVMQAVAVVVIRNGPRKSNLLRESGEFG